MVRISSIILFVACVALIGFESTDNSFASTKWGLEENASLEKPVRNLEQQDPTIGDEGGESFSNIKRPASKFLSEGEDIPEGYIGLKETVKLFTNSFRKTGALLLNEDKGDESFSNPFIAFDTLASYSGMEVNYSSMWRTQIRDSHHKQELTELVETFLVVHHCSLFCRQTLNSLDLSTQEYLRQNKKSQSQESPAPLYTATHMNELIGHYTKFFTFCSMGEEGITSSEKVGQPGFYTLEQLDSGEYVKVGVFMTGYINFCIETREFWQSMYRQAYGILYHLTFSTYTQPRLHETYYPWFMGYKDSKFYAEDNPEKKSININEAHDRLKKDQSLSSGDREYYKLLLNSSLTLMICSAELLRACSSVYSLES